MNLQEMKLKRDSMADTLNSIERSIANQISPTEKQSQAIANLSYHIDKMDNVLNNGY